MAIERSARKAIPDVAGARALVYSLGIEGRDLARWLMARGATVSISDSRSEVQLAAAGAKAPAGVERVITGEQLNPTGFDLLAVSQSVLRTDPGVLRARELRMPVVSQMGLALRLCRGRLIGITGSSGKSTTTAMVSAMAEAAGIDYVVGGNLGGSLLHRIEAVAPETAVILEISHTQLQYTERSPEIAAVTNVTPNHLDQFSWDDYVDLKRNLLRFQSPDDLAILNADDETSRTLREGVRGRLAEVSLEGPVVGDGAWLADGQISSRWGGQSEAVLGADELRVRGRHNLENTVMAVAVAAAAGLPAHAIAAGARGFGGLPHRLEVVGRANDATWINDSIATSPERTIAALKATAEPVLLLLGGREKALPLGALRSAVAERCRAVICFGEAGALFGEAMKGAADTVQQVETLDEAVALAAELVRAGDIVLLSPAGTSFDAYPRFEARGEAFATLVAGLDGFEAEVSS